MNIYITKHQFIEGFFLPVAGQATSPAEERQDITVLYNKMTLGELQSTFSFNVSVISESEQVVTGLDTVCLRN